MDCLYSLIMDMAESGNLYLELDDTEEKAANDYVYHRFVKEN